jgi:transaldolase
MAKAMDRRALWMKWSGLVRDDARYGYVEIATGRFICEEALDAYAREKLDESIDKFAHAWAHMVTHNPPRY